ncbi:MAG TPA: class I SAM-dependent methyltransferase [Stellaceae bacterium]|nr:class I SAM-dependent methyltransferase [Stellaceae bacterium]
MLTGPGGLFDRAFGRPGAAAGVSRNAAIWAYRLLLGREPESESVIRAAVLLPSRNDLVRSVVASPEFQARGLVGARRMDEFAAPLDVEWRVDPATLQELLAYVSATWTELGRERPHWSVLAGPEYLPDAAASRESEFYDSGLWDLRMLLATLARVGREPGQFPVLFEFGCGLGRVTWHLGGAFERVIGADISVHHLELARQALQARGIANVELRQATLADFGMSQPYDLWFSRIVLQHNPPPVIAAIIERALRMLRPQGLAVFQVPVYLEGYRFKLDEYRRDRASFGPFEMHALPQPTILDIARAAACTLLEVREDGAAGDPWISQVFTFQKR